VRARLAELRALPRKLSTNFNPLPPASPLRVTALVRARRGATVRLFPSTQAEMNT
jgi:hypothetical protein